MKTNELSRMEKKKERIIVDSIEGHKNITLQKKKNYYILNLIILANHQERN